MVPLPQVAKREKTTKNGNKNLEGEGKSEREDICRGKGICGAESYEYTTMKKEVERKKWIWRVCRKISEKRKKTEEL